MLERDTDLAELIAHLDRARAGRGGMVLVTGESGAGKSTLLQSFVDSVGDDVEVLWSSCDPLSPPRPLGPVHDLADQLGDAVRSSLREARQPHEIFSALFEHLRLHPSVLVVDDLHWADQGTIDLLRFVLRRIRVTGSLVVAALRDDEVGQSHRLRALLGDIARSADAVSISLRPLSIDAIRILAEDRSVDARWLREVTGGNPFFVVEMIDYDGAGIPRTVRDAVLARTTELTDDAWDLLHLLACAPEAIPDHLLVHLGIGLPPLRRLDDAGLVRRGHRGVAFRHDLCRLAITSTMPPGGEVSFHVRMLDALESSSSRADPAVLAHHAAGAGDAIRTLRYATEAGRAAARSGAHTQAAAFFRIALDQPVLATPTEEAELLELLAESCYLIDHLDDAIAASEQAMMLRERNRDPAGVSTNHRALSVYQWYNANRPTAEHHADAAVSVLEAEPDLSTETDRAGLGHAFVTRAYLAMQASDLDGARTLLQRADEIRAQIGTDIDPSLSLRVRLIGAICDVLENRHGSRESTLSILDGSFEHLDEIYSGAYSNLTYLDVEQRRLRHANELLGYTLPLTVERDLPICYVWQLGARGRLKLIEGDWPEAIVDADIVLSGPSAPLARTWPHLLRGLVRLRTGGDADADLEEAWQLACRYAEPMRMLPAAAALVERAWLKGQADDRLETFRELLRGTPSVGLEWARGELAAWLHRLDPTSELDVPGDLAEPYRLQMGSDFTAAAAQWATLGAPYERALALIDSGTADNTRAGLDILDGLGADEVAAKVRQDLRRGGATTIPSRRRESTRTNPAGLTNRQVEILRLLSDGSTNAEIAQRLFLSPKTVDHHVSALLSKLHATTRRDAVRRGGELGILD
jgi:DNA-binding CsgD family transcriptional regulator